ncbi:MAG: hypothetical protein ACRBK7_20075 [Acidimicrobiales bacterium]
MNEDFGKEHLNALRSVDRRRALDWAARQRITEQMISTYEDYVESSPPSELDSAVELVVLDAAPDSKHRQRETIGRWLVAAAAAVIAVAATIALLAADDAVDVEAARTEVDPGLTIEVHEWCVDGLEELSTALRIAQAAPADLDARTTALAVLFDTVQEYLSLLLDSKIREGSERANEVGRFEGEVGLARDRSKPTTAQLTSLTDRFADELAYTSNRSLSCEIPQ